MTRLFLKIAMSFLVAATASRWFFFLLMDQEFYSDRERFVSGLCTLQLGTLRMVAAELQHETAQGRTQRIREWGNSAAAPMRLIPYSQLSEPSIRKLSEPNGFVDEYRCGILDWLTVAVDADSCLQMGPLADRTQVFIEEDVRGVMSVLSSRMAAGQLSVADLPRASERLGVPLRIRPISEIPKHVELPTRENGKAVLFHEGRDAFVVAALDRPDQLLCVGPLIRVRAKAEATSIIILLAITTLYGGLVWTIVILLSRRFRRIEKAAVAMANGDFSVRVGEQYAGEAGSLVAAFNRMADATENAIRARRDLLNMISHELRTPVARLRFAVELLEEPTNGAAASRISVIKHSLDDLEKITIEALEYVQLDGRPQPFAPQWIDSREVISKLLDTIAAESPQLNVQYSCEDTSQKTRVFADPAGFYRVLSNLTSNAQRFARSALTVRVIPDSGSLADTANTGMATAQRQSRGICVMVDDDGPGIPEHLRISVLQPFVRGTFPQRRTSENKTDENYPHIGLGLAIALAILEQHAGRLVIQTNESGGCRITTWWPNSWKQQAESPGEGG